MSTIVIAVLALAALAAVFGAILGFASIRFKVEADPSLIKLTPSCRKPNVANAATPDVALTPRPLPMAMRLTSALLVAKQPLKNSQT